MDSKEEMNKEVRKEAKIDIASQIAGILTALLPVLGVLGISFDWLTEEFIDSVYIVIAAIIAFVVNIYTIYKNHFSGGKAQQQNKALKERGLK